MSTVIWKELREHARWVPIAFATMLCLVFICWAVSGVVFDQQRTFVVWFGWANFVIAMAFGILQTVGDQRPGARALLIHRGISAERIFFGKVVAMLILYGCSVFAPLLILSCFFAIVCPDWGAATPAATIPAAIQSVIAIVAWFAATMFMRREGRIWGSRLLPIIAAGTVCIFSCAMCTSPVWWHAFPVGIVALPIFLVAARGVFVTSDTRGEGVGLVSISAVLMIGLTTLGAVLGFITLAVLAPGKVPVNFDEVVLGSDGQPWAISKVYERQANGVGYHYRVDSAARLEGGAEVFSRMQKPDASWETTPRDFRDFIKSQQAQNMWNSGRFALIATTQNYADQSTRNWVFDNRRQEILVYASVSGRVGYHLENRLRWPSDTDGSGLGDAVGELRYPHYSFGTVAAQPVVTTRGIITISEDGAGMRVHHEFPDGSDVKVVANPLQTVFYGVPASSDYLWYSVLVGDSVVELGVPSPQNSGKGAPGGIVVKEFDLPRELITFPRIQTARDESGNRFGLGMTRDYRSPSVTWMSFNDEGEVSQQESYSIEWTPSPHDWQSAISVLPISPPGVAAVFWGMAGLSDDGHNPSPKELQTGWLVLLVVALVGAMLAWVLASKRGLSSIPRLLWCAGGFVMGPFAAFAVLAAHQRIRKQNCPECGVANPIDQDCCGACQREHLGAPNLTGIEIFHA